MYAGGAVSHAATPVEELARALCPGFFLAKVGPALGTQPSGWTGLNTTLGQSVSLALGAEFKHQTDSIRTWHA